MIVMASSSYREPNGHIVLGQFLNCLPLFTIRSVTAQVLVRVNWIDLCLTTRLTKSWRLCHYTVSNYMVFSRSPRVATVCLYMSSVVLPHVCLSQEDPSTSMPAKTWLHLYFTKYTTKFKSIFFVQHFIPFFIWISFRLTQLCCLPWKSLVDSWHRRGSINSSRLCAHQALPQEFEPGLPSHAAYVLRIT